MSGSHSHVLMPCLPARTSSPAHREMPRINGCEKQVHLGVVAEPNFGILCALPHLRALPCPSLRPALSECLCVPPNIRS